MKALIAIDDSPHSEAAIDYVLDATWPQGCRFVVLSAVEPIFTGPWESDASDAIGRLMQEQEKYHREIAQGAVRRLAGEGLIAEATVVVGDARAALLDAARAMPAKLIVVGSHGRTGVKKLLLGSVASHVVTHAPCSVLVVRGKEQRHE